MNYAKMEAKHTGSGWIYHAPEQDDINVENAQNDQNVNIKPSPRSVQPIVAASSAKRRKRELW